MVWNLGSLIVVGGIAGWLASIVLGRNKEMGCWANIGIGILGALIMGLVMIIFFPPPPSAPDIGGVNLYSIILGTLGAVLLLLVTGWYRGRAE